VAACTWLDVLQGFSVVGASIAAIYGINTWRREFVGKRRMELAEETLTLFYEAKDIIAHMRHPVSFGGEGKSRPPSPEELEEHKDKLDSAYVLIERYMKNQETFAKIHALRYRFMARFGFEAARAFEELNRLVNELLLAARRMARLRARDPLSFRSQQDYEEHERQVDEVDRIYYSGWSDGDPIEPRVVKLIEDIEKVCRPIINSRRAIPLPP